MFGYDKKLNYDVLLSSDEIPLYLISVDDDTEYYMTFRIFEVCSWDMEDNPFEIELYLSGTIKWDGSFHLTFGEDGDGYLHLGGKIGIENHCLIMKKLYELAKKKELLIFNK